MMNESLNCNKNLIQSDQIFSRFQIEMNNFKNINKGDRILLAVSGGLDSMALLFMLNETNLFDLNIGHVNHGLRLNSGDDEKFVSRICDKLSLPFYSKQLDPSKMKAGESVEKWARNERYLFLTKTARLSESRWIMTAHLSLIHI